MEGTENLHQLTQLLSVVSGAIDTRKLNSSVNINELCQLEAKIIAKINEKL